MKSLLPARNRDRVDVAYIGFVSGHGGDALQMLALATGVAAAGRSVRIIVPDDVETTRSFAQRCEDLGIRCERTSLIKFREGGAPQRVLQLMWLMLTTRASITHFHSGYSQLPRVAQLAVLLVPWRRALVTIQSAWEMVEPDSVRARLWSTVARLRLFAVVSPSKHGARYQVRCGVPPRLAITIPNSFDPSTASSGDGSRARRSLNLSDQPLVVFTSRLDPIKRPLDALRIFAAVSGEFPTAALVMVGVGSELDSVRDEVERLGLADRVHFAGYRTDVPDWLAAATVWLLPTERENFSLAVLEALAAGCAVLSTSCPGNDEVLVDGVNALTFDVGDVAAGATALRRLLGDEALRQRLGAGAQASSALYVQAAMVDKYLAVYDRDRRQDS
jgi:glycosyltransferase involved in cell wall biosynthesis